MDKKRRQIDSAVPGTSSTKRNEDTGDSSVQKQTLRRSSRKRANRADHDHLTPIKETSTKKRRYNSSTSKANEALKSGIQKNYSSVQQIRLLDDLPPEILEAVLQNVTSSDLLNCRQINRKWNEISSRIMRQRADIELRFCSHKGHFMQSIQHRHFEQLVVAAYDLDYILSCKSLTDLVICLINSEHFPFTCFHFDDLANFANDDMRIFLSIWGKKILALNVSLNDPIKHVGILRDLLFVKVPNLKSLEVQFSLNDESIWLKDPSSIQLFADSEKFQLPKLEVLIVNEHYRKFRGIIENILAASCNLNQFDGSGADLTKTKDLMLVSSSSYCVEDSITAEDLTMLQSLNKCHCLKNLHIRVSEELIAYWPTSAKRMEFKLHSLSLSVKPSIARDKQLILSATAIINQLFNSSKDVIHTLSIEPMGFLAGLIMPKLENLNQLNLWGDLESESAVYTMFPPLFEMADAFPNLNELHLMRLKNEDYFPSSQPLKPIHSIKLLRIYDGTFSESKEKLIKATPNVQTLLLVDEYFDLFEDDRDFIKGFQMITNNLTKLESFFWALFGITHHSLMHFLDAVITGLSVKFCEKLSAKLKNKNHLSAEKLAYYQLQRQNSSILDLKQLKELDIAFFFDLDTYDEKWCSVCGDSDCVNEDHGDEEDDKDEAGFDSESQLYETGFTKVSKFLAFDLNPNLKIRTRRNLQ